MENKKYSNLIRAGNIEEFICRSCKKKFLRRAKRVSRKNPQGVRGLGCVTCSKKCSKENHRDINRIYQREHSREIRKRNKEKYKNGK